MKKYIIPFFLLISLVHYSQDSNKQSNNDILDPVKFLIKAGSNYSLYSSKQAKWDGEILYQVAVGFEVPITGKIYIQPEFSYFKTLAKWGGKYFTNNDELRLTMLAMPVMLKYKITEKFEFELGPQIKYLVNVSRTRNNGVQKDKPRRYVNDFDLSVSAGVSYDITEHFGVNARYSMGLKEVDKRPGLYLAYTASDIGKLSLAQLNLYYRF